VAELFAAGDDVRTTRVDPSHHCRLPRYARGAVGTVLELQGSYRLADDSARGIPAEPEPVYTVRFQAQELFGSGNHVVTVDIWESHLAPAKGTSDER